MKEYIGSWLTTAVAVLSGLFLIFILTAPPVMIEIVRGRGSFPLPYAWVMTLLESDFGGPLIWYFNDVWGAGILFIGEEASGPPLHIILMYVFAGLVLFLLMALPFWKRRRRRLELSVS